jgi:carbamate kinase
MGPKVEAAARFVAKTGGRAAIGSLADIAGIVAGTAGTNVISLATGQEAQRRWLRPKHLDRHHRKRGKRST